MIMSLLISVVCRVAQPTEWLKLCLDWFQMLYGGLQILIETVHLVSIIDLLSLRHKPMPLVETLLLS